MRTIRHPLLPATPGTQHELVSLQYGTPGARPKVAIQASLHADEVPGMLVAHHLRSKLAALELQGRIKGEVVLVPAANPLGLSQWMLRAPQGRFDYVSGENFNRHFGALVDAVHDRCAHALGPDADANVQRVRAALRDAVAAQPVTTPLESLRKTLLGLAIDADAVLDLHCDGEALLHLYTTTPTWDAHGSLLARCVGAEVVLLADHSGGEPFDEACSMVWVDLAKRLRPDQPLPPSCMAATIELRGEGDVTHPLATHDADALIAYLHHRGVLQLDAAPTIPDAACAPTPLAGSMPLQAPHGGVIVFLCDIGQRVQAGQPVAEIIDPLGGGISKVASPVDGLFYARDRRRYAVAGMPIGKVAGQQALRAGSLLSA